MAQKLVKFCAIHSVHEPTLGAKLELPETTPDAARAFASILSSPAGSPLERAICMRAIATQYFLARSNRQGRLIDRKLAFGGELFSTFRLVSILAYMHTVQSVVKTVLSDLLDTDSVQIIEQRLPKLDSCTLALARAVRAYACRCCPKSPLQRSDVAQYLAFGVAFTVWATLSTLYPHGFAERCTHEGRVAARDTAESIALSPFDSQEFASAVLQHVYVLMCGTLPVYPVMLEAPIGTWRLQATAAMAETSGSHRLRPAWLLVQPLLQLSGHADERLPARYINALIASTNDRRSQASATVDYDGVRRISRSTSPQSQGTLSPKPAEVEVEIEHPIGQPNMQDVMQHLQGLESKSPGERRSGDDARKHLSPSTRLAMDSMSATRDSLQVAINAIEASKADRRLGSVWREELRRGCHRADDVIQFRSDTRTRRFPNRRNERRVVSTIFGSPLAMSSVRAMSSHIPAQLSRSMQVPPPESTNDNERSVSLYNQVKAARRRASRTRTSHGEADTIDTQLQNGSSLSGNVVSSLSTGLDGSFLTAIDSLPDSQSGGKDQDQNQDQALHERGVRDLELNMDEFVDESVCFEQETKMYEREPGGFKSSFKDRPKRRSCLNAASILVGCASSMPANGKRNENSMHGIPLLFQATKVPVVLTSTSTLSCGGAPRRPRGTALEARETSLRRRLQMTDSVIALEQKGIPFAEACDTIVAERKAAKNQRGFGNTRPSIETGTGYGNTQVDALGANSGSLAWRRIAHSFPALAHDDYAGSAEPDLSGSLSEQRMSRLHQASLGSAVPMSVLDHAAFEPDARPLAEILTDDSEGASKSSGLYKPVIPTSSSGLEALNLYGRVSAALDGSNGAFRRSAAQVNQIRKESAAYGSRVKAAKDRAKSSWPRMAEIAAIQREDAMAKHALDSAYVKRVLELQRLGEGNSQFAVFRSTY